MHMHMSSTWGLRPRTPTPSAGPDFSDAIHFTSPRKDMRMTVKPSSPSEYPLQDVEPPHCPRQDAKRHWLLTQGLRPRTPTPSAGPDFFTCQVIILSTRSHRGPTDIYGTRNLAPATSSPDATSSQPQKGIGKKLVTNWYPSTPQKALVTNW